MIPVIMTTHNGAATLPLTLEALKGLSPAGQAVEMIAVDNASSDGTPAILEDYQGALPLIALSEPQRGKSFALSRALDAAHGELMVFTDDDVLAEPQWLQAYEGAAGRLPDVGLFAGQVRHHWEKQPPPWLLRLAKEGRSYGGTPVDQPEGPVPPIFFKGANRMARRLLVKEARSSERPEVNFAGPRTSVGGEDTIFVRDAVARGHRTYYVTAACVRHIVRRAQPAAMLLTWLRLGLRQSTPGHHSV